MPIYGRTLREAATTFEHHLNALLTKTITLTPIQFLEFPHRGQVIFGFPRQGRPRGSIELATKYGLMELYLGQTCDAVEDEDARQLRLRTISYEYDLRPVAMDDHLVRWEFVRFPGRRSRWSRHHVQGQISIDILDDNNQIQSVNLNDWHLPTGWVPIEEVIRFCLHDLEARALSAPEEWHLALIESYETFRPDFARNS